MSLQATQDNEKAGEEHNMNSSGYRGLPRPEEEMPSTAVIQMTIQPQAAAPVEFPARLAGSLAAALAELPQALLDVGHAGSSSYDYVAELEPPPLARYAPAPAGSAPPRPAFSYRSDAALAHQYAPVAHSADTYDYTDEGEFALERAPGAAAGAFVGAWDEQGEEIIEEPLDIAGLYHELERGFDLARYEGVQLLSDPPSVEYADNGALLQSELFELDQGGFDTNELAIGGELEIEQELISAGLQLTPPEDVQLTPSGSLQRTPLAGLQLVPFQDLQLMPAEGLQLVAPEGMDLIPPEDLQLMPAEPAEEQPGPSRSRAHAVQIYPGEGEGEPQTCYITNLPRLAIEETFFQENVRGEAMPLQARPLPAAAAAHNQHMLRQLLGAPGDDEGDVPPSPSPPPSSSPPPSPSASEDSCERDKENKLKSVAAALRSAALSFAADDSNTETTLDESERDNPGSPTEATADLSEAMEQLSVSEPAPDTPEAEETESVAALSEAEVMESDSKITSPIMTTKPTPASSSRAGESVDRSVKEPSKEDASPEIGQATDTDTAAATLDVDSDASDAPELMASSKKRKHPATAASKTKKAKKLLSATKPKRKYPGKLPAALKTGSIQLKAKTARKAVEKGYSTAIVPIESASESTISSEDSCEFKTLSVIIAENNAAAAKSALAVEGSTAAAGGDDNAVAAGDNTAAAEDDTAAGHFAAAFAFAAASAAPAAPAILQAKQSGSKAKGKRAASAQIAQTKQKQAKKVRPAPEVPTTTMVLRSRTHMK